LPRAVHVGVERAGGDAELLGHIGCGVAPVGHHRHGRAQLRASHQPWPATRTTAGAGRGETGHGALAEEVALELGQGGEDAEHEPPGDARGIDAAGQHPEADAAGLQRAHQLHHMGERAADPVQLPDHERIAGADHVQRTGEAGSVGDGTATRVLVDPLRLDAGGEQRVALQGEALLGRGHPHVADQHRRALPLAAQTIAGAGLLAREKCTT
jgi:hypothetical protein